MRDVLLVLFSIVTSFFLVVLLIILGKKILLFIWKHLFPLPSLLCVYQLAFTRFGFFLPHFIFLTLTGWYLVWKLFLSRFKLIRELFFNNGHHHKHDRTSVKDKTPPSSPTTKSSNALTPSMTTRSRSRKNEERIESWYCTRSFTLLMIYLQFHDTIIFVFKSLL